MDVYIFLMQVARILVMLGALNWGMIGIWGIDVIARVLGSAARIMYILIGVSGIYILIMSRHF